MMKSPERIEKIRRVVAKRQKNAMLVLEKIHDPHNVAAILRSAEAFGFQKIGIIFETGKKFNPRRVGKSSSSSANKWLDYEIFPDTEACLAYLKKNHYQIAVTMLDPAAVPLTEADFRVPRLALVLGNEHRGVSAEMVAAAEQKIYIPMRGFVQSLNVSVSAALVLHAAAQARNERKYFFSGKDKDALAVDFSAR